MAIRDRFRRALHKSTSSSNVSSDNSSRNSANNITTTSTAVSDSSEGSSPRTATSSKLFLWRSHDSESSSAKKEKSNSRKSKKSGSKPVHPRDKPLTATNLRHQEMLSGFNMTFGSSPNRLSQLVPPGPWDDYEGVSPCCTRSPSFDGGIVDPMNSHDGSSTSLDSDVSISSELPPPKVAIH